MNSSVKAVLTSSLISGDDLPVDIQYMPPGKHQINASRNGKPVTLEIQVDSKTAETLDSFLQAQLASAEKGSEDRPFFDFNHEDREAAAWPTEFFWAGDDLKTGGVRAKVEWSGAGQTAVEQKTFRRFSPTFIPDQHGKVIGSETNMGGLVNRAAFKSIQSLFAKSKTNNPPSKVTMDPILSKLRDFKIIDSVETDSAVAAKALDSKLLQLTSDLETANNKVTALESEKTEATQARAKTIVESAVNAGRIAPDDTDSKSFWTESLLRDEENASKAIEALPVNPVLAKVTSGDDPKSGALNKMSLQQKKLSEIKAAHPQADFQTIFAKAQTEAPDLFR